MKAGPISVEGYYLFASTNKFYCHFGGQAIGVMLAFLYYDCILPYRKLQTQEEKAESFPNLHNWIKRPWISYLVNAGNAVIIGVAMTRS